MNEKLLSNLEYERYINRYFGNLNKIRNKLYYKIFDWEKDGMKYSDSMAETKRYIIDDIERKRRSIKIHCKKWIQTIDIDWKKGTGKSEWLYLIELFNTITWIRVEIDNLSGKILDIEDANIIKYPSI